MTQSEKLQKALNKSVENGWFIEGREVSQAIIINRKTGKYIRIWFGSKVTCDLIVYIEPTIFSHDFAKAFWGEEKTLEEQVYLPTNNWPKMRWECHLMRLALTPEHERIDYLFKFCNHEKANQ